VRDVNKWLLKNIDIKILSLFLAIILWLYVASGENPVVENFIDAPIIINNLMENTISAGYVLLDDLHPINHF